MVEPRNMQNILLQMCCLSSEQKVYKLHESEGKDPSDEAQSQIPELPEHVDNPFINRDLQKGILGFRYETKNAEFTVYSSSAAKTFCTLMKISPIKN